MTGIDNVQLEQVIVHKVGNPSCGEQLKLSVNPLTLNDELVKSMLNKYFLGAFNENEHYHFTHLGDVGMNEVYNYVTNIFEDRKSFTQQSALLAHFLYSKSTHVKVKEGELYVASVKDVPFGNDFIDAVGIFKSETKETFLKVFEHGGSWEVIGEEGININKPDKGCLVFNTKKEDGYVVCVVDATNKQQDAQYWVKDFLQVEPYADSYHNTNKYMVVRNPKTKFRSPSSDGTFNVKSPTAHRTLQHICKAHKTHRTKANLAKELQLPTHGKQSYNLTADHYILHLQR